MMLRIIKPYALKTRWVKPLGEKEIVEEASPKNKAFSVNHVIVGVKIYRGKWAVKPHTFRPVPHAYLRKTLIPFITSMIVACFCLNTAFSSGTSR